MSTNTNWEHRFLNLQEDSYCLYQLKAGTLKGKAHGIVGKLLHSGTHYADSTMLGTSTRAFAVLPAHLVWEARTPLAVITSQKRM